MLLLKHIKSTITSLLLLITLLSFSGFIGAPSHHVNPQIELFCNAQKKHETKTKHYTYLTTHSQKVLINQYTVFNFKRLLNTQLIDYSLSFKSQEEITLEFLDLKHIEQHYIVKTHSKGLQYQIIE